MNPFLGELIVALIFVPLFVIIEFMFDVLKIFRSWSTQERILNILFPVIILFDVFMMARYALDMDPFRVLYSLGSIGVCIYGLHVVNNTEE